MDNWISVKDRLPKESCECLVVDSCKKIYMVEYSDRYKLFNAVDEDDGDSFALRSVTHWQPLPEPPKGE